jgi:hypothetical protein
MVKVMNKMDETRFWTRMNEWMNGKSIDQKGWKQDFEHEWMNDKSREQIILSLKKARMNEKKSDEQNGWKKILSKNKWMNGKSIEQKGWNETSSKNEWMNEWSKYWT